MLEIKPIYEDTACYIESELMDEKKIELDIGKFHKIPTHQIDLIDEKVSGTITNLPIVRGKNIVADLIYTGRISCRDLKYSYRPKEYEYRFANPLFNTESMQQIEDRHYRFSTNYPDIFECMILRTIAPICLDQLRYAPPNILEDYLKHIEVPEEISREIKNGNKFIPTLGNVYKFVRSHAHPDGELEAKRDFDEILEEFIKHKKIHGSCKSRATFTAGLLNSLGIPSRIVSGHIFSENSELIGGHVWAEAYIPIPNKSKEGCWAPIDPSTGVFLIFPSKHIYTVEAELPEFYNESIKSARLRISYE